MKKYAIVGLLLCFIHLVFCGSAVCEETLFDVRNKIFEESKEIKPLLLTSNDTMILNSMRYACIITMTQLDAYFAMLGVLNTVKQENMTEASINYYIDWLNTIKQNNRSNADYVKDSNLATDANTQNHMKALRGYFTQLEGMLNKELKNLMYIRESVKLKKPR